MHAAVIRLLDRFGHKATVARLRAMYRTIRRRVKVPVWNALESAGLVAWKPLVPEQAFTESCRDAIRALRRHGADADLGDYLEFGVSRGTSMACVHEVLQRENLPQVRLIGFDSFEGMPPEAAQEGWVPGEFKSTLSQTRAHLAKAGVDAQRVTLVPGWFTDILTARTRQRLGLTRASVIMVDCDIYSASLDALLFCAPLMQDRAVVIFDDWGWQEARGEIGQKEAFDEFLAGSATPFDVTPLPSYRPEARVFLLTSRA